MTLQATYTDSVRQAEFASQVNLVAADSRGFGGAGRRLQTDHIRGKRLFPYASAAQVFDEHRETTRGQDLDIAGLSYAILGELGPQQRPFPAGATKGKARLYEDGKFPAPSGRARFVDTQH